MAIDNQYVQFQIIKSNRRRRIYLLVALVAFVCTYGIGYFILGLQDDYLKGLIGMVMIVLSVGGVFMKQFNKVGQVGLYPHSLEIKTAGETRSFPIDGVVTISFRLKGIEGLPHERSMGVSNGMGNTLEVITRDARFKEQVFVSNEFKIRILKRLFQHYETLGVKTDFDDG